MSKGAWERSKCQSDKNVYHQKKQNKSKQKHCKDTVDGSRRALGPIWTRDRLVAG